MLPEYWLIGSEGNEPLLQRFPSQHSITYELVSLWYAPFPSNDRVLQYSTTCSALVVQPLETDSVPDISRTLDFQHYKTFCSNIIKINDDMI